MRGGCAAIVCAQSLLVVLCVCVCARIVWLAVCVDVGAAVFLVWLSGVCGMRVSDLSGHHWGCLGLCVPRRVSLSLAGALWISLDGPAWLLCASQGLFGGPLRASLGLFGCLRFSLNLSGLL